MGKIVKFCSTCDEGFAAKFGFCPNCGAQLSAFEMNPISTPAAKELNISEPEVIPPETVVMANETLPETAPAAETQSFSAIEQPARVGETTEVLEEAIPETPVEETKTFAAAA